MTVFLCIDDNNGMLFNGRRQSRDAAVLQDVFTHMKNAPVIISPFSEKMFSSMNHLEQATISDSFLNDIDTTAGYFVEDVDITPYLSSISELVLYHWNREYPFDMQFTASPKENGFSLKNSSEFEGTSHEKITKEVWVR